MTLTRERRFTYDDYRKLPDGLHVELIDGELIVSPAPAIKHQDSSGAIYYYLRQWVEQRKLGKVLIAPVDVIFPDDELVQPDVLFIQKRRFRIIHPKNIQGAPDLVVEVISPSNKRQDYNAKYHLYEKHRVREYWIVEPEKKSVMVQILKGKKFKVSGVYGKPKDVVSSFVVAGFRIPVAEIFRGLKKH